MTLRFGVALTALLLAIGAPALAGPVQVTPVTSSADLSPLPVWVGGRAVPDPTDPAALRRQWPGTYFETSFTGTEANFRIGPGDVIVDVLADGSLAAKLTKPAPGFYAVKGLASGMHSLRVEVVSESQSGPTMFGGFYGKTANPAARRPRQIEFIGDSYTVGYGNTSPSRQCPGDGVWLTTDTSQGFAVRTAKRLGADYQINAISGRGIVRNYGGFAADTLPQVYRFVLFDKAEAYRDPAWHPQLIVIGLGTNDFSTPLQPSEKWKSREDLHADYEAAYLAFLARPRAANRQAFFILWSLDNGRGEIESEISKVAERWRASGESRVAHVAIHGTEMSGCDWHPSIGDDALMAKAIGEVIEAHPEIWAPSAERG